MKKDPRTFGMHTICTSKIKLHLYQLKDDSQMKIKPLPFWCLKINTMKSLDRWELPWGCLDESVVKQILLGQKKV